MISLADKRCSRTDQVKHFLAYLSLAVTQQTQTQIPRLRPLQCCARVAQWGHFAPRMARVAALRPRFSL